MGWREAVGKGFGPHREGEPAELRRDIMDELTDHLDCAMRRELVGTSDERAAEQRVLARFGDPRRIARRLWLDAMKETIMSQRIMLGVVVLLAAACVAASVFAWLSFRQGQQLNEALLARLEELGSRPAAAAGVPSDLAVAKIRVVEEGEGGKPVPGAQVSLEGNPFEESQKQPLQERTGADGVATLGPIRPGTYRLRVFTPAGLRYEQNGPDLMLFGGRENEKVIVCPRGAGVAPAQTDVSLSFAWPEDIPVEKVLTSCVFVAIPSNVKIDGFNWYRPGQGFWVTGADDFVDGHPNYGPSRGGDRQVITIDGMGRRSVMPLGAGQYRLEGILIWSVASATELATYARSSSSGSYITRGGRLDWMKGKVWYERRGKHDYVDDTGPTLEARVGVVNEWKIDIPENLLAELRESLAAQEAQDESAAESSTRGLAPGRAAPRYGPGSFDR